MMVKEPFSVVTLVIDVNILKCLNSTIRKKYQFRIGAYQICIAMHNCSSTKDANKILYRVLLTIFTAKSLYQEFIKSAPVW